MRAKQKMIGQIALTIIIAIVSQVFFHRGTELWIPLADINVQIGWLYYLVIFFVLVGTSNAVNLTDGLDGLAAGTTVISAAAFSVIAFVKGHSQLAIFAAATSGLINS